MEKESPKQQKPSVKCGCGHIFPGLITEDTKCPKCGATENLSKWSGGLILG